MVPNRSYCAASSCLHFSRSPGPQGRLVRRMVGCRGGPDQRASPLPPRIAVRVAVGNSAQIAPQIGFGVAIRIDLRVGLAIAVRTRPQISFRKGPHVALQITHRIAEKTHPPTLVRTPLETAPGTVPGTVPAVVPGMSVFATLTAPNAVSLGYLGR